MYKHVLVFEDEIDTRCYIKFERQSCEFDCDTEIVGCGGCTTHDFNVNIGHGK